MDFRILSVGVSKYIDRVISPLSPCDSEAESVFAAFCDKDFGTCRASESILLKSTNEGELQSSRANIMLQLKRLAELAKADEGLIVYFSGHGVEYNGDSHLICHDTQSAIISNTAVLLSSVFGELRKSKAKYKILILDCCKPGFLIGKDSMQGMTETFQKVIEDASRELRDEGLVILASCKANQVSHILEDESQSVFTHYLLAGLSGGISTNDDRLYISLEELYEFVLEKVRDWSLKNNKQQVPYLATELTGALKSIELVKWRPTQHGAGSQSQVQRAFTVVNLHLVGSRSFSYPTKVIVRRNRFVISSMIGNETVEVDEDAKPSVNESAQNYSTTIMARFSALLLKFYGAKDIKQTDLDRIDFPLGNFRSSVSNDHTSAIASYKLQLTVEEPSLAIAEEARRLLSWDSFHADVDFPDKKDLAEIVEHFRARSWEIQEFMPGSYAKVNIGSFGTNSRPAEITVSTRGKSGKLQVKFLLYTVSKEHDLSALVENIAVILGV